MENTIAYASNNVAELQRSASEFRRAVRSGQAVPPTAPSSSQRANNAISSGQRMSPMSGSGSGVGTVARRSP